MTSQRIAVLSFATLTIVLISAWLVYAAIQTSKTTYDTGAPPPDVVSNLQPQTIPLNEMHPPAPRASDPIRYGSATSVASVIEFGDYECPNCHDVNKVIASVLPTYHGRVRFIWRDLPVTDVNPDAMDVAIFARCAGLQGKYWEAHDDLFSASSLGESTYAAIAASLKLNASALASCRADSNIRAAIQNDIDTSRADGENATPFLFIGTTAHQGVITPEELKQKIDAFIAS